MAQRLPHSRSLNAERGHFGHSQFRLGETHGLRFAQRLRLYLIAGVCTVSLVMAEQMSRRDGYPSQLREGGFPDGMMGQGSFWNPRGSSFGGSFFGGGSAFFPQEILPFAKADTPNVNDPISLNEGRDGGCRVSRQFNSTHSDARLCAK